MKQENDVVLSEHTETIVLKFVPLFPSQLSLDHTVLSLLALIALYDNREYEEYQTREGKHKLDDEGDRRNFNT